jgi:PKD repeat protein
LSVDSPKSGCSLAQVPVKFKVKNSGLNSITPNMSYSINGGPPVNQTFAILQKDSTRTYQFTQNIDFSSITGPTTIRVWSNLSSDVQKSNDTIEYTMENYSQPPKPKVLNDTVCDNELISTLEAKSSTGFITNWFTDNLGVNKIGEGDFRTFNAPFINTTLYVNSTYEKFVNEGMETVVNAVIDNTNTKGLNFTVSKPRVRLHSVKVEFTVPGNARIEIRTQTNVVLNTINYTVVNPGLNQVPIGVDLNAGNYRIVLAINPGASVSTVINANPFNPSIASNGAISITSAFGTTTQYPFFYDWNVSFAYCTSTMDSVKLLKVTGQNSPFIDLRDSSLCSYPSFSLDAQNPGMRYMWSTGETTQKLEIKNSGTYKLTVTNSFGCNVIDSSSIIIRQSPVFNLGTDSTICSNKSIMLSTGFTNKGYNHLWLPSQKLNPYLEINSAGQVICEVFNTNTNCGFKDTIIIGSVPAPSLFLGKDTFTCKNNPIILQAPSNLNFTYLWHDLSTTASKLITSTVMAKVTLTDTSNAFKCKNSDSIFVRISDFPKPNLGADKIHCGQEVYITHPATNGFNYKWSNGYLGNITYITKDGNYILTVTENGTTCSESDTINVKLANSPKLTLGDDIISCTSPVTLTASSGFTSYSWSGGGSTSTKVVSSNGSYTVTASNSCETVTDNINVTIITPPSAVSLPADIVICNPLVLSIPNQPSPNEILWSTGAQAVNSITVDSTANYWVSVSNKCGTISDAIYVKKELPPVADFDILKTGMFGVFTNKSQNVTTSSWEFGDDSTSTSLSPSHKYLKKGTYIVKLTITNSCGEKSEKIDSIIIDGNSSILNSVNPSFEFYPNPVSSYLNIKIKNVSNGEYVISIYDIYGKIVTIENIKVMNSFIDSKINLESLTNGFYLMDIKNNGINVLKNEKIIINK